MPAKQQKQKAIQVCAHWQGMSEPVLMGTLFVTSSKGKEIFSFEYGQAWLESPHAQLLDPHLVLFTGRQYTRDALSNFGLFLDSCPDRWGRVLMKRREEQEARMEKREARTLLESDYLLGVYDAHRIGALRFRLSDDTPFLDNQENRLAPPWTRLRDLEHASLRLEDDNAENESDYSKWITMLIAPGASLGGARPKAGVFDEAGHPWIAKFPSRRDEMNIAKWEYLLYLLAQNAGIKVAQSKIEKFSGEHETFLVKRFDRTENGERLHFSSAMTLLGKKDGDGANTGVSYLGLAEFIVSHGARVNQDLEQLWRRIVFHVCVSNTDDHLRNHGFMLTNTGWALSPAYDMNPVAKGNGLSLNISNDDNDQDLDLVLSVANYFRIDGERAGEIIQEVKSSVKNWATLATELSIPSSEVNQMKDAFRVVNK